MLIGLAITSGAIYYLVDIYQKRRQKQTLGQEIDKEQCSTEPAAPSDSFQNPVNAWLAQVGTLSPVQSRKRVEQLSEVSSTAQQLVSDAERDADRKFTVATFTMGIAALGLLFYPPLALLSIPGVLYISQDSFRRGYDALRRKGRATVDIHATITRVLLIASGNPFYASISSFNFGLNLKLLTAIKGKSQKNTFDLLRHHERSVWILVDGAETEVPFESLSVGDLVVVTAGGTIPVDGSIVSGAASVDQRILTGESQPIEKEENDPVFALSIVLTGRILIRVERTGEETTAANIANLLSLSIDTQTDFQLWSESLSDRLVMPTLLLSSLCLPLLGPLSAIAILRCHFGYRATIVNSIGLLNFLNLASLKGILVKDGRTFESLNKVDTVVFDKTGTLTEERPHIGHIYAYGDYTADEILTYAATAEQRQTHPIATAILVEASNRNLTLGENPEATYIAGYGLQVESDGRSITVGSLRLMESEAILISLSLQEAAELSHTQGYSLICVAIAGQIVGAIELCPTIRPEARSIIHGLRQRGIKSIYIISGDHDAPTQKLATELGMDHYFAQVLPKQKAEIIQHLQSEGKSVCYIGDGINDTVALQQADVSVSLKGASTIAVDIADVILMNATLEQLCELFDLAARFDRNMKKSVAAILIPNALVLGSTLLFGTGLFLAFLLPQLGLWAGIANSMLPSLQHRRKTDKPANLPEALIESKKAI